MYQLEATEAQSEQLDAYRRLLARDPGSLRFAEYADTLRRSGQLLEAMAICLAGLARHPGYCTAHVVLGEILTDSGKDVEAEAAWQEALRLDPGHPRAHLRLGELHFRRGDVSRAIEAFEAALVYSPDYPEARAKLALARGREEPRESPSSPSESAVADATPLDWLERDTAEALLKQVTACADVESAVLVDSSGSPVAGEPRGSRAEGAAPVVLEVLQETKGLLSRLAAGRPRSVVICSDTLTLRCVALDGPALVCALRPEARIGQAAGDIDAVIAEVDAQMRQRG